MPLGHGSFGHLKRRRLRPSLGAWGVAVAGIAFLGSSLVQFHPYDTALLVLFALVSGTIGWWWGRQAAGMVSIATGALYLLLNYLWGDLVAVEALRGVPGALGLVLIGRAFAELGYTAHALRQTSLVDQVTHLPNYSLMMEFIEREAHRSRRYRLPFCVVVLELQDWDEYGRTYGFWRTDSFLADLARVIAHSLRKSDVVGRLGGPQFGLLFPMTNTDGAMMAVARLDAAIRTLSMSTRRGLSMDSLRWSVGVAEFPVDGQDGAELLQKAGQRLQQPPQVESPVRQQIPAAVGQQRRYTDPQAT